MMRRKSFSLGGAVLTLVGAVALFVVSPAEAQPYQPGPCRPLVSSSHDGSTNVGGTLGVPLTPICLWDSGTNVAVSVNGSPVGTKVANPSGFVIVNVTATSATELSVDDPVIVSGHCGRNEAVGVGFSSAAQADVTHTTTFDVLCPGAAAKPARAKVALTGANVLRWTAIGLGLVVVGGLFVAMNRRRSRAED